MLRRLVPCLLVAQQLLARSCHALDWGCRAYHACRMLDACEAGAVFRPAAFQFELQLN